MKPTTPSVLLLTLLTTTVLSSPTDLTNISPRDTAAQIEGCGAAGSCVGPGGGDLCNDRVSMLL